MTWTLTNEAYLAL